MQRKYKHILFDLDNTIWDFETNSMHSLQEVFHVYELSTAFSDFNHFHDLYKFRNNQLWASYSQKSISKKVLNFERFNYPLVEVGINDAGLVEKMAVDYLERCAKKTNLMPYAFELLSYLKDNYQLHILSNGFAEVQYLKLKNSGLEHFFDRVILSEQVGVLKPDVRIFDYAVKSLNARKKEVLMIGDNFDADICGARKAKIDQLYYAVDPVSDLPFIPTYTVKSLLEVKNIL